MRTEQLNSATDGHRISSNSETVGSAGAMNEYYDAIASRDLYMPDGELIKGYQDYSVAFQHETSMYNPAVDIGSKVAAGKPGLPGRDDSPTAAMTFEYFREKCRACDGVPCPPPKLRPKDFRIDDRGYQLPESTSAGVRRI